MIKLSFYVPESHLEQVKSAMFNAGAGKIGLYDCCCWQMLGQGQFRALPGSDPYVGAESELCCVPEYQVEMVCDELCLDAVIAALKQAHPYEEPAYGAWRLLAV